MKAKGKTHQSMKVGCIMNERKCKTRSHKVIKDIKQDIDAIMSFSSVGNWRKRKNETERKRTITLSAKGLKQLPNNNYIMRPI